MNDDLYLEKTQEFYETNKDNLYLMSVESLYTIDNPDIVQISLQRIMNDNISKEDFIFAENKIISFLEYLYIKSEKASCYCATHLDGEPLKKQKYVKKSKEVKTFIDYVTSSVDNDKRVEVENINALRGFAIIGIRLGATHFYFENPDMDVVVDDCQSFYIKFVDSNIAEEFILSAHKLGINADKLNT